MTFFISWPLWQQMTFGLAGLIVIVFMAGLVKLWWITRRTRKYAIVDQEKKARLEDMRRTGLAATKPGMDIPFGVRAIQSGIEIEGIWISRPNTPVGTPLSTPLSSTFPSDVHGNLMPSSTTLIGDTSSSEYGGSDRKGKGREDSNNGPNGSNVSSSAASSSSSDGEGVMGRADTYKPKGAQGDARSRTVDTYIPSNPYSSQPPGQAVALRPLTASRTNSPTTGTFPTLTPQGQSGRRTPQQQYSSGRHSPSRDHSSPRGTPVLGPQSERNNTMSDLDLRQPTRTFGPGDAHSSRTGAGRSPPRAGRQSPHGGPNKLQKTPPGGYL